MLRLPFDLPDISNLQNSYTQFKKRINELKELLHHEQSSLEMQLNDALMTPRDPTKYTRRQWRNYKNNLRGEIFMIPCKYNLSRDDTVIKLRHEIGTNANEVVGIVMMQLINLFSLEKKLPQVQPPPQVIVFDTIDIQEIKSANMLDWGIAKSKDCPPSHSFFSSKGKDMPIYWPKKLLHSRSTDGPTVGLFLPQICNEAIIEETIHYLHWYHSLRYVQVSDPYEQLNFLVQTEAIAYAIRSLIGIEDKYVFWDEEESFIRKKAYINLRNNSNSEQLYASLFPDYYPRLCKDSDSPCTLSDLAKIREQYMIFHDVGYLLGKDIANQITSDKTFEDFSEIAFSNDNPLQQLAKLVEFTSK